MSLIDFAGKLLQDPTIAQTFLADPESALQAAGLDGVTPEDVRAVLPGVGDSIPSGHPLQTFINPEPDAAATDSAAKVIVLGEGDEAIPGIAGMVVRHADGSVTDAGTDTVIVPQDQGASQEFHYIGEDDWSSMQPDPDPGQHSTPGDGSVMPDDSGAFIGPADDSIDWQGQDLPNVRTGDDADLAPDNSGSGAFPWLPTEGAEIDHDGSGAIINIGDLAASDSLIPSPAESDSGPYSDASTPEIEGGLNADPGYDTAQAESTEYSFDGQQSNMDVEPDYPEGGALIE